MMKIRQMTTEEFSNLKPGQQVVIGESLNDGFFSRGHISTSHGEVISRSEGGAEVFHKGTSTNIHFAPNKYGDVVSDFEQTLYIEE